MSNNRPDLGFASELDNFDPDAWEPSPKQKERLSPPKEAITSIAEASGFRSREPKAHAPVGQGAPQRRRRTGRNAQFNIKADPDVIARFTKIADQEGWVFGEAFEHAVALLEARYGEQ
jgi:hypothetical protein